MPSRREFIQHGLAASALTALGCTSRPAARGRKRVELAASEPYQFFRIVFDQASQDGAAFGAETIRQGAPAHAAPTDIGSI